MKTIRVVIDAKLLRACDRILEFEQRDQRGYEMTPQSQAIEESDWEAEAVWPDAHS